MLLMETPLARAADVDAAQIECPLNIFVSTPASAKVSLTHREIDADVTGLWGFLKEITSWEPFTRSWAVFSTYISKVFTGHRESASLNALKKISLGGPERRIFVRPGMTNLTPSPVDCLNLMSRAWMSEALLALHRANKVNLVSTVSNPRMLGRACETRNGWSCIPTTYIYGRSF